MADNNIPVPLRTLQLARIFHDKGVYMPDMDPSRSRKKGTIVTPNEMSSKGLADMLKAGVAFPFARGVTNGAAAALLIGEPEVEIGDLLSKICAVSKKLGWSQGYTQLKQVAGFDPVVFRKGRMESPVTFMDMETDGSKPYLSPFLREYLPSAYPIKVIVHYIASNGVDQTQPGNMLNAVRYMFSEGGIYPDTKTVERLAMQLFREVFCLERQVPIKTNTDHPAERCVREYATISKLLEQK